MQMQMEIFSRCEVLLGKNAFDVADVLSDTSINFENLSDNYSNYILSAG